MPRVTRVRATLATRLAAGVLIAAVLATGLPAPSADAAAVNDPSDIVLVLDFSGSILVDQATRSDFADALVGIADRVEETSAQLTAGDAAVSIVQFATRARDLPGCTDLRLRENPAAVTTLANCLRAIAGVYRNGGNQTLLAAIGDDTNYVAAMERAATHLPADSPRPAIIFFTDGKHEAAGVPVEDVVPARARLFGDRSPFALLPVGMGLDPADRARLEAGLLDLQITRDLERCEGGEFEWPQVVFESADRAGQAVALALQDVSCTFTVEPTPTPVVPVTPSPEPAGPARAIRLDPADAAVLVTWFPPIDAEDRPVEDYLVRCRPNEGGDWVDSTEGVSTETSTSVGGLANGVQYRCEVAVVRDSVPEAFTMSPELATPFGRPPAPAKPIVEAINQGARLGLSMPANAPVSGFTVECSPDGGTSWPYTTEIEGNRPVADIAGLSNGTEYVCRAIAVNDSGASDASPASDVFRPCSNLAECSPLLLPFFLAALAVLLGIGGFWLARGWAGRRVYVTAQVDGYPSVSLGRGPTVRLTLVRRGQYREVAGAVATEKGSGADIRIRYAGGGKFDIRTAKGRVKAQAGRVAKITDSEGQQHDIVVRAFDEPPSDLRLIG